MLREFQAGFLFHGFLFKEAQIYVIQIIMSEAKNPFLSKSNLPHGAFPFSELKKEHFFPALDAAIAEARAKLDEMKTNPAPASFENALVVLETAAERVGLVSSIFFNLLSAESDDKLQTMARDFSPKIAAFSSDVSLDAGIFARIQQVYDQRQKMALQGEKLRLTEKTFVDFVRNGALLNEENKTQLREIDQELSRLAPEFSDNVLKATNAFSMILTDRADLAGLPESAIEAAAETAKELAPEAAKQNSWAFTLQGPSLAPFLTYSDRRDLREKMWRASGARAFKGEFDNQELCKKIVNLRYRRAKLLGYEDHAAFVLQERMAESSEKVRTFLDRILNKSVAAAKRDIEEVRALKKELTGDSELMGWDYAYFSEKLKMKSFNLDDEALRPYFKLENVIEGAFEHARRLYGLNFKANDKIQVYHPDVKAYEVTDESNGKFVGLFYTDFFPRATKRNGAWMTSFREQGLIGGQIVRPHVSIVCNFTKPTPTKPSLLTLDEVKTLFHEFGHSLHALLSDCVYTSISGTNVYWDFVELPSQIMENWVLEKEALDLFAEHFESGEKIPVELTTKIKAAANFQAGFNSMRQIQFSLLDMAWHAGDPIEIEDVDAFEERVTAPTRILPRVPGVNSSCSFSHIFAGGYSAGYYSYKWAEVLDADAFELFKEKGLFDRQVANSFRDNILSRGGTEHPMELYKRFRGREPDPDALLRRDGLI